MPNSASYVAAYDIGNDRERERVAQILEGFGFRVQGSVFECRLTASARSRMMSEIKAIELKTGFLCLYRLRDGSKRLTAGEVPDDLHSENRAAFVI